MVIDLTMDGNRVVMRHQYLLLGVLVLLLPCIPGSKYLIPTKKIISNTVSESRSISGPCQTRFVHFIDCTTKASHKAISWKLY